MENVEISAAACLGFSPSNPDVATASLRMYLYSAHPYPFNNITDLCVGLESVNGCILRTNKLNNLLGLYGVALMQIAVAHSTFSLSNNNRIT